MSAVQCCFRSMKGDHAALPVLRREVGRLLLVPVVLFTFCAVVSAQETGENSEKMDTAAKWQLEQEQLVSLLKNARAQLASSEEDVSGELLDAAVEGLVTRLHDVAGGSRGTGDWPVAQLGWVTGVQRALRKESKKPSGNPLGDLQAEILSLVSKSLRKDLPPSEEEKAYAAWLASDSAISRQLGSAAAALQDSSRKVSEEALAVALDHLRKRVFFYEAAGAIENAADENEMWSRLEREIAREIRRNKRAEILEVERAILETHLAESGPQSKGETSLTESDEETVWQFRGPRNSRGTQPRRKGQDALVSP